MHDYLNDYGGRAEECVHLTTKSESLSILALGEDGFTLLLQYFLKDKASNQWSFVVTHIQQASILRWVKLQMETRLLLPFTSWRNR